MKKFIFLLTAAMTLCGPGVKAEEDVDNQMQALQAAMKQHAEAQKGKEQSYAQNVTDQLGKLSDNAGALSAVATVFGHDSPTATGFGLTVKSAQLLGMLRAGRYKETAEEGTKTLGEWGLGQAANVSAMAKGANIIYASAQLGQWLGTQAKDWRSNAVLEQGYDLFAQGGCLPDWGSPTLDDTYDAWWKDASKLEGLIVGKLPAPWVMRYYSARCSLVMQAKQLSDEENNKDIQRVKMELLKTVIPRLYPGIPEEAVTLATAGSNRERIEKILESAAYSMMQAEKMKTNPSALTEPVDPALTEMIRRENELQQKKRWAQNLKAAEEQYQVNLLAEEKKFYDSAIAGAIHGLNNELAELKKNNRLLASALENKYDMERFLNDSMLQGFLKNCFSQYGLEHLYTDKAKLDAEYAEFKAQTEKIGSPSTDTFMKALKNAKTLLASMKTSAEKPENANRLSGVIPTLKTAIDSAETQGGLETNLLDGQIKRVPSVKEAFSAHINGVYECIAKKKSEIEDMISRAKNLSAAMVSAYKAKPKLSEYQELENKLVHELFTRTKVDIVAPEPMHADALWPADPSVIADAIENAKYQLKKIKEFHQNYLNAVKKIESVLESDPEASNFLAQNPGLAVNIQGLGEMDALDGMMNAFNAKNWDWTLTEIKAYGEKLAVIRAKNAAEDRKRQQANKKEESAVGQLGNKTNLSLPAYRPPSRPLKQDKANQAATEEMADIYQQLKSAKTGQERFSDGELKKMSGKAKRALLNAGVPDEYNFYLYGEIQQMVFSLSGSSLASSKTPRMKYLTVAGRRWDSIDDVLNLSVEDLQEGKLVIEGYIGEGITCADLNGRATVLETGLNGAFHSVQFCDGSAVRFPWVDKLDPIPNSEMRLEVRAQNPGGERMDPSDFPPMRVFVRQMSARDEITAKIQAMSAAFERLDVSGFMRQVSPDFYGGEDILRDQLRRFFDAVSTLRLYIVPDTFAAEKKRHVLTAHWERTYVPRTTGSQINQSGNTTFIFDRTDMKLLALKGDSLYVRLSDTQSSAEIAGITTTGTTGTPSKRSTLSAHNNPASGTFKFSTGQNDANLSDGDFFWNGTSPNETIYPTNAAGIQSLGSKDIDQISSVPSSGYGTSGLPLAEGNAYAFKTTDGKYAAIVIVTLNSGSQTITFDWKYQPDGTPNF